MAALVSPDGAAAPAPLDNLGARILSAIVLIPPALAAAIAGEPWLAGAAGAAVVAMAYEWARMSEPGAVRPAWALALIGALGGVMIASHDRPLWALAWVALWALFSAVLRRRTLAGFFETAGGVLYVGAPCVAFLWLRANPDYGRDIIIALFVIIWSVDVAAYFAGKLIGGPLLWPSLSPHKTYAGIAGGLLAGLAAGFALAFAHEWAPAAWAGVGFTIGACGLAGDLFESALKRRFGVKDASRLIPGHGGVLDRLDGMILATSVVALTLAFAPGLGAALFGRTG
jgi:phosphatidate cytidylyltransferase